MTAKKKPTQAIDKAEVLRKALLNAANYLSISRKELSAIIGISEPSLSRLSSGKGTLNPDTKEGELALLFLRLFRSLDALFGGNEQQCRLWLRHYNTHLDNIPINFIQSILGFTAVVSYLDAMRAKI